MGSTTFWVMLCGSLLCAGCWGSTCQSGPKHGTTCVDEQGYVEHDSEKKHEKSPKPVEPDYVRH